MKKRDLVCIVVNLSVTILFTILYVFGGFSSNVANFFEKVIYFSLFTMYILSSFIVYERMKGNEKHLSLLNRVLIVYTLSAFLYILSFLVRNSVALFIFTGVFLAILFMSMVTYTAVIFKLIEKKERKVLTKLVTILSAVFLLSLGLRFLIKTTIEGNVYAVTISLTQVICVSALIGLLIIFFTYIIRKLILFK